MALKIAGYQLNRVAIIDDKKDSRESMEDDLRVAKVEPKSLPGPFPTLEKLIDVTTGSAEAAVCDYKLNEGNYAGFSGAEAVAEFYQKKYPALLITSYVVTDIDQIRPYRHHIPVLIKADDADADSIIRGFELCINELKGIISYSRKSWRTLVRIEEIYEDQKPPIVIARLPSWNPHEAVRFPINIIPGNLQSSLEPGKRFHARVNIGAEDSTELYLIGFEN